MIWESRYWKEELRRSALKLKRSAKRRTHDDRALGRMEQLCMIGFYAIRKLAEANKLTDRLVATPVEVSTFSPTGKHVDMMNSHRLDDLSHLNSPALMDISLIPLCHQFVHSFVFSFGENADGQIDFVYVASDRARGTRLYGVPLPTIVGIFDAAASDFVSETVRSRDDKTLDWKVSNS